MSTVHSGGDLMMVGPRVQSHRLQPNEALELLNAFRSNYRAAFTAGDKESAQHALRLSENLSQAIAQQRQWMKCR